MTCDDAIKMGLNMMSKEYGIDASSVIPALMTTIFNELKQDSVMQQVNLTNEEMESFRIALSQAKIVPEEKMDHVEYKKKVIDEMSLWTFTIEMKNKLALARANGKDGWHDKNRCSDEHLAELFYVNLQKSNYGNFIDLANFLMFLHVRQADPKSLLFITERNAKIENV